MEIWQVSSGCTHFGKTRNTDNKLTHRCLLGLVPHFSRFSYPSLLFILPTLQGPGINPFPTSVPEFMFNLNHKKRYFSCYYRKKHMRTSYLCCKGCGTSQIFRVSLEAHFVPWMPPAERFQHLSSICELYKQGATPLGLTTLSVYVICTLQGVWTT